MAKVYVVRHVSMPLLGRDVFSMLNIIAKMDSVTDAQQQIITQYPQLFTRLGCMRDPYTIRLKPDAQLHVVFAPRRILLPLLPKVKEEIDRLLQFDAIARVEEPTPWCTPIVVVLKQTGASSGSVSTFRSLTTPSCESDTYYRQWIRFSLNLPALESLVS